MPVKRKTDLGKINISDDAIATLAGSTVNECYGVVGMVSKNHLKDGYNSLLGKENYSMGIVINNVNNHLEIDVFIIVIYGVKISEVVLSVQQRVKYTVETSLNIDVDSVNVHVEGIKVNG